MKSDAVIPAKAGINPDRHSESSRMTGRRISKTRSFATSFLRMTDDSRVRGNDKQKRETVAAVIMTKNCAQLVQGTLESVKDWVDEIAVIDGFSSDNTVEVCRRYTDKVFQNRWDGYRFCTERNLGTRKAASDWCLHIDPDERATPEFRDAVIKILKQGTSYDAFEFRKKNYFLGRFMRHGGWYHTSLHFFRCGQAVYEGVIHENLKVNGPIGRIEAAIEHFPFTSIRQFVARHNGYSKREALEQRETKGILPEKEVLFNLKKKPLKRFVKFYIRKRGFLDGMHGFVFSVLFAWVHFINWAKYWELTQEDRHLEPDIFLSCDRS